MTEQGSKQEAYEEVDLVGIRRHESCTGLLRGCFHWLMVNTLVFGVVFCSAHALLWVLGLTLWPWSNLPMALASLVLAFFVVLKVMLEKRRQGE